MYQIRSITCNHIKSQGASEFALGGVLEHWSITDRWDQEVINETVSPFSIFFTRFLHFLYRLGLINKPTLVMRGEFDTMTEECSMLLVNNIPTARPLVTIPRLESFFDPLQVRVLCIILNEICWTLIRAAHCKLLDEPALCAQVMADFLQSVESTRVT